MIKKAAVVVVSGLILMVAVAFLIYPTPYRYIEIKREGGSTIPIKTNILTGKTQFYVFPTGWSDEKEPSTP